VNLIDPLGKEALVEYELNVSSKETTAPAEAKLGQTYACDALYAADMEYCAATFLRPDYPHLTEYEICAFIALLNLERCIDWVPGAPGRMPLPPPLP
jgi:hypothetical protein